MHAANNRCIWVLTGLAGICFGCAQFLADDHCTFHGAGCDSGLVCSWCDHENRGCVAPQVAPECIVPPYGDGPTTGVTTDIEPSETTDATTAGTSESTDPTDDSAGEVTSDTDETTETTGLESCGDGEIQAGEVCDDGNQDNNDACTNACQPAICGDGVVWVGVETCDDANQSNTDGCLNSCELASCGDGFIEEGKEDCDDQNEEAGDGCHKCWKDRLVFITSEAFKGDLGGLEGADSKCQAAAQAAQLPGTYKAWLSLGDEMPQTRMLHAHGVYKRVDGVVLAHGWSDLTDGLINATISVTELGETLTTGSWTNTEASGVTAEDPADCDGWTTQLGDFKGRCGSAQSIEPGWSNYINDLVNPTPCGANRSLYCVMQELEQP